MQIVGPLIAFNLFAVAVQVAEQGPLAEVSGGRDTLDPAGYVLACMRGHSFMDEREMSPDDKKRRADYAEKMADIVRSYVNRPDARLKMAFAAHKAVMIDVLRWHQTITIIDTTKINLVTAYDNPADRVCERGANELVRVAIPQ